MNRCDGSTLVEMIVSMTVASIVVAQVFVVLSTQQAVHAGNKRVVEAQQDARLVTQMIQSDIRMAGFLVPTFAGISNRDGGTDGTDALCISDSTNFDETKINGALEIFDRAVITQTVGSNATEVRVDESTLDIDGSGGIDFVEGQGIILADSDDTHCAIITGMSASGAVPFKIHFSPETPATFDAASPEARAVPALIYWVSDAGLNRNELLLSPMIEDLQVAFGIDSNDNGLIASTEFHHDLDGFNVSNMRQVRLTVTAKTNTPDPSREGYGMPGSENHLAGTADGYIRRQHTSIVVPRNIAGL